MTKNLPQIIQDKIDAIEAKKAADRAEIEGKIVELGRAIAEQTQEAEAAAATMDTRRYSAAKEKIAELEITAAMYSDRQRQLDKMEFVTPEESEKVIADLLEHEKELEDEFAIAAAEHFHALKDLADKQRKAAAEAESVLTTWTQRIRPNYISKIGTFSDGTNRAPYPVPIHPRGYFGGELVARVDSFLSYREITDLIGEAPARNQPISL